MIRFEFNFVVKIVFSTHETGFICAAFLLVYLSHAFGVIDFQLETFHAQFQDQFWNAVQDQQRQDEVEETFRNKNL